jgi:hypothetical protein
VPVIVILSPPLAPETVGSPRWKVQVCSPVAMTRPLAGPNCRCSHSRIGIQNYRGKQPRCVFIHILRQERGSDGARFGCQTHSVGFVRRLEPGAVVLIPL